MDCTMNDIVLTQSLVGGLVGGRFHQSYDSGKLEYFGEIRSASLRRIMCVGNYLKLRLATTEHRQGQGVVVQRPMVNAVHETSISLGKFATCLHVDGTVEVSGNGMRMMLYPASHADVEDFDEWFAMPSESA